MRKQKVAKTFDFWIDSLKVSESLLFMIRQNGYFATLRSAQYDDMIGLPQKYCVFSRNDEVERRFATHFSSLRGRIADSHEAIQKNLHKFHNCFTT